ncbi:hypothetical protein SLITO_v1c11150 [Spiroplasma litorale]|uniref:Transmembrane protein n=1 Tax=Spiroplasma litorale TaxID=216942 RepID=A0A0K1W3G0_9MOLU|nr:hypothetical protein [Spiroplasma litorale]AKX34726.1 hypothetical protein SLITO_v1c11150 [Spiroplasma litorale]
MIKKLNLIFFIWCATVPFFCIILDLVMSTIQPVEEPPGTYGFDKSVINQIIYWSVWGTLDTFVFGLLNLIHYKWKNMPKWVTGKNNFTRVTTDNVILLIIWLGGLAGNAVVGFNSWYKIIKAILEHVITPILIILYYFIIVREKISSSQYSKKYTWFNLLLVGVYSTFVISRAILIEYYAPKPFFTQFPYDQMDPSIMGWPLVVFFFIGFMSSFIFLSIFINYMSNLSIDSLNKRKLKKEKVEQKNK